MAGLVVLKITSNATAVLAALAQMSERARSAQPVLQALGERMVEYSIPENFQRGGRPTKWARGLRGGQTGVRRGHLANSFDYRLVGSATLEVGTNRAYAAYFHFGGVQKPKTAKSLAIPLMDRPGARPKHYSDLKWAPSKKPGVAGLLGRFKKKGRGKARKRVFEVLFVLKKEVTNPPRPVLLFQTDDIAFAQLRLVRFVATGGR